ncbi:class I SAM-dependent methyltransferase [candidate division CSSED10-310 bacterium]|uniref:Class I SAM-dependent methyltransferase n=1 Tax=candidate division CSSED10-310 bacterium TaxID=2855610 RepID=A0ABV6YYM7_UNCC1
MILNERTIGGLHDFLFQDILPRHALPGAAAIDLGAGSGALAVRLSELGLNVTAVDINQENFKADMPFIQCDLNQSNFSSALGDGTFDFVIAVEVIEHLESPIVFLRNVRRLLKQKGMALISTPNMDNVPSRARFFLTGKLHMMDERVPNHISPIFYDLFTREYLPRAGFILIEHQLYPRKGFKVSRASYVWMFHLLAHLLPGHSLRGDINIFILQNQSRL